MILLKNLFKIIFIMYKMDNKHKEKFIQMKKVRREKKRTDKRSITGEEVIFIFEKVL